ncbi:MAG: HD domain-containing protein [Lachnospiraceae bacterium]|nr:HD domain-containing protein [Lachnospiraceae bacterium]
MKWKKRYRARATVDIFFKRMEQLKEHNSLQVMKKIRQHRGNNTFRHSLNVAYVSFYIACKLDLKIDCISLATGAMLHDYYLYDTDKMPFSDWKHSLYHPRLALINALEHFYLNKMERNIILSHMWPVPFAKMPRSREAALIVIADMICSTAEETLKKREIEPDIMSLIKEKDLEAIKKRDLWLKSRGRNIS